MFLLRCLSLYHLFYNYVSIKFIIRYILLLIFYRVNDRIISANGVSLEGADYGRAVRVLRDSGSTVLLVVKRRASSNSPGCLGNTTQSHRLTLTRNNKKDGT